VNGYLVDPSSPAALAGAIIEMLREPATIKRMGQASHRLVARFDVRQSAALLQEMYTAVADGPQELPTPGFG